MLQKNLKKLMLNPFVQGGVTLTVAHLGVSFFNYLSNIIVAKSLGPSAFGEFAAMFAYVNIFSVPLVILITLIIRRLGKEDKGRLKYAQQFIQWFWLKIRQNAIYLTLTIPIVLMLPSITGLTLLSSITLSLIMYISFLSTVYTSTLQGLKYFNTYAIAVIAVAVARFVGSLGTLFGFGELEIVYFFLVAGGIIPILLGRKRLHSIEKIKPRDKKLRSYITDASVILAALSLLGITMLNNIDIIYVKRFFSPETSGLYGGWSLYSKIILYFIGPLNIISLIFFSSKEVSQHRERILRLIILGMTVLGVIMFATYSLFGEILISIFFNDEYLSILPFLPFAAVFGTFYTLITLINNYYIALNDKRSLIVSFSIPIYVIALVILGNDMKSVIEINVTLSAGIAFIYLISLFIPTSKKERL